MLKHKKLGAMLAILLIVALYLICIENGPWRWTKSLKMQDVSGVTLIKYGQEYHLEETEIGQLLSGLNDLNQRDLQKKTEQEVAAGVTLEFCCKNGVYTITRADVPYGQFELLYDGDLWCFESEALNEGVNDVLERVYVNDLSPAGYPLSILLTIPQEEIMDSLGETMLTKTSKTVDDTVRELLSDYVSEEFNFLSDFGSLWLAARQYGFSTFLTELKVTNSEENENHFNYEALLDIRLESGETEQVHLEGVVRCNRNRKVTSISQRGKELDAFLDGLDKTNEDAS